MFFFKNLVDKGISDTNIIRKLNITEKYKKIDFLKAYHELMNKQI